VLLLAWLAWQHRWMSDDGLINLRVVDQVMAGHGPVFNAGERVEAGTSPLWIALLVAGDLVLPLRLEWIAVLLGIAASLTGLAAAIAGSARLWGQAGGGVLLPVGALCLVALTPVWDFSSSGLESGLAFCWLGVSLLLMQRWAAGGRIAVTAVVVGLGPLIRPDLALVTLLLVAVIQVGTREVPWSWRCKAAGAALALPVAYELFRMAYYGALVPNTYFAKEGGEANWSQGWVYLRDFVRPYGLWLPVLVLGAGAVIPLVASLERTGERRAALVAAAFPVGAVVTAVAIVRIGGDFMHARLLLPSLFAGVAPVATVAVRRATALALVAVPWAVVCLVGLRPRAFTPDQIAGIADHRGELHMLTGADHVVTLDDYGYGPDGPHRFAFDDEHRLYYGRTPIEVDGAPPALVAGAPERVLLAYGVGAIGYFAGPDTHVVDMLGLGDSLAARLELRDRGPLPGHEKALPAAWVWARYVDPAVRPDPGLIVAAGVIADVSPTLAAGEGGDLDAEVEAARAALRCGELDDVVGSPRRPLTVGRMVDNLVLSVTAFDARVPPRPTEAERTLC
jgi:arabinofuranosyltransferase